MAKKTTKGRKRVQRSLPPLAEMCAEFQGFHKEGTHLDQVCQILAAAIQRHRRSAPQLFYAMREVAKFFGVSLTTISSVYRRLGREGVLTVVRSSQTMIPARVSRPRFAIRGVVCMPIWLPGFLQFLDWREHFSELEEELSRHRFVLEPIFYKQGEEVSPEFVDRVLKFNPDYVLWNNPAESDRMTMESIADAGVRLLTILALGSTSLPGRMYRTSYERATRRGLEDWKASGQIDRVIIIQGYSIPEHMKSVLQSCPLAHESAPYDLLSPFAPHFQRLMTMRRVGIIFADDAFFSRLCGLAPEEMFNLFRRHRTMISCRVTMQSLAMPTGVKVDWMSFPSRRLAQRIAMDLSQSKGPLPSHEELFEAEWQPHTPLEEIVQIAFTK